MTMSGEGTAAPAVPVAPARRGPVADRPTTARPPWWCAHRSRSSAVGVLVTAALVCVAAGVAVVGFVSVGSTVAALIALFVLAVGAANVVSGSFGAAWWAQRVPPSEEVTSMNSTDHDRRRDGAVADPLPRRPVPVVPAAREGRHAAQPAPGDEPTTQIPATPPPGPPGAPHAEGLRPVPTVGPPPPAAPPRPAGPNDPTVALPAQHPEPGPDTESAAERPGPATVRAAAKRAAARPGGRTRRVAGRPGGDQR